MTVFACLSASYVAWCVLIAEDIAIPSLCSPFLYALVCFDLVKNVTRVAITHLVTQETPGLDVDNETQTNLESIWEEKHHKNQEFDIVKSESSQRFHLSRMAYLVKLTSQDSSIEPHSLVPQSTTTRIPLKPKVDHRRILNIHKKPLDKSTKTRSEDLTPLTFGILGLTTTPRD